MTREQLRKLDTAFTQEYNTQRNIVIIAFEVTHVSVFTEFPGIGSPTVYLRGRWNENKSCYGDSGLY